MKQSTFYKLKFLMVLLEAKPVTIFSLGKILYKIGLKNDIPLLIATTEKCLDTNPTGRPTTIRIMPTLVSMVDANL